MALRGSGESLCKWRGDLWQHLLRGVCEEYRAACGALTCFVRHEGLQNFKDNSQYFSEQLQNVSLSTEWLVESGVEGRFSGTLRTVAKIIKSREAPRPR